MSGETQHKKTSYERWNLDDDDFNINENTNEDEEQENELKKRIEELLVEIKKNLKGETHTIELPDVPRYINKDQVREFFKISDPNRFRVNDPDPKNKRTISVTFFNVDDFCSALKSNGAYIGSYLYNPIYNLANQKQESNERLKSRISYGKGGKKPRKDEPRYPVSGDVRNQDRERERERERERDRDRDRDRDGNRNRDGNHDKKDNNRLYHKKSGKSKPENNSNNRNYTMSTNNRYNTTKMNNNSTYGGKYGNNNPTTKIKGNNRFSCFSDSDE